LSEYRKKKIEYQELQYHVNIVEPDAEDLKKLAEEIQALKNELNKRENIPTKEERRTTRQIRAKKYKGGRRSHKKKN
jgi:hypothetical protein